MSRKEQYSQLNNNNNNNTYTTEADASLRDLEIGNMITKSIYDVLFDSYKSEQIVQSSDKTSFCFEDGAFIFYDIDAQLFNLLYYANKDPERTPRILGDSITSAHRNVGKKRRKPNHNYYKHTKYDVEKFSLNSVCKGLPSVCATIFGNEALTHLMPWLYKHKDIISKKKRETPNLTGKFIGSKRINTIFRLAQNFDEFTHPEQVDTIRIRFLDHPSGGAFHGTWGKWISLNVATRARDFNKVNQMERIFEHSKKEDDLCPLAGKTTKPKGVIKFYHYQIQLKAGMRGGEKTIPFTYVKFESKSFTNNMGHHKETNRKKKKAFQTTGGEKTGMMTGDSITTFDIQPLSDTSKKTNCFAKTGIKNICYRAEDVTPPDSSKYDEWKADWNPGEDNFYKYLRTGQEFYVSHAKTNEIVTDIKARIERLQLATRQFRMSRRGGKRRKTRKQRKKKTRRKKRNRKKRTRKR